jgi:glutamate-1-semialdehyde 2,1-aminomutase
MKVPSVGRFRTKDTGGPKRFPAKVGNSFGKTAGDRSSCGGANEPWPNERLSAPVQTVVHPIFPHLGRLLERELERFRAEHPRSYALTERAKGSLLGGVPMHWMVRWAGGFPVFATEAGGARFRDVDGHEYVDFCLGDTGAMTGHSPEPAVQAVVAQASRGITLMLPSEDALVVGEELARRFGLPYWQLALTATDANRFAIRIARAVTGRPKILVFNWCYHGTVDETFATLVDGAVRAREGSIGPPVDPSETTRVVEFNDVEQLERELAHGDTACVLAEPALTNIGIVLPLAGYHDALRDATRRTGTLLIVDETHTICAGPGGYTAAHGLEPDLLTIGKPIGSGIPAAAYGFSAEVAERIHALVPDEQADVGGIGGTLAANVLSLAAVRATLEQILTDEAFERMIALGKRFEAGVQRVIDAHGLPWHVTRLGCRVEYLFRPDRPRTGADAAAGGDAELDRFVHLYALNRGILLTPFHNMALMSPATSEADVDYHTEVFESAARELTNAA